MHDVHFTTSCQLYSEVWSCHPGLHLVSACHADMLQEGDVRQLFAPFGTISSIEIMKDMAGQSQGYGYVEFTSMPDASKAMQQWDGQEVVGQKLSVKVATMGGQPGALTLPQLDLDDDEGNHRHPNMVTTIFRCLYLSTLECNTQPNIPMVIMGWLRLCM